MFSFKLDSADGWYVDVEVLDGGACRCIVKDITSAVLCSVTCDWDVARMLCEAIAGRLHFHYRRVGHEAGTNEVEIQLPLF